MLKDENLFNAEDTAFDLIVVGSGNGACGFLSECLKHIPKDKDYKILVLEQGKNFFHTSDITHQNNWSKSYGTDRIFLLHNAATSSRKPIITGRANTMGGGGSINYTMVHESSKWLMEQMGHDIEYWDGLKAEINGKLKLSDPFTTQTKFAKFIQNKAMQEGDTTFGEPRKDDLTFNVPSLDDDFQKYKSKEAKQLYVFPTQFNKFGQRTNSGVSIVDWNRVSLRCETEVTGLHLDRSDGSHSCTKVEARDLVSNEKISFLVKAGGRVVLASGSQSPRLLMRAEELTNPKIGKRVNDHICMVLGLYLIKDPEQKKAITPKNIYEPLLGTMVVKPNTSNLAPTPSEEISVVNLDFFTGELDRLLYIISSLFLAYLPFNRIKRFLTRFPGIFSILCNSIRILLTGLFMVSNIISRLFSIMTCGRYTSIFETKLATSLIKFNSVKEGYYVKGRGDRIVLEFFEDERDSIIAEEAILKNLDFLNSLGRKPPFLIRWIFQLITRIPYEKEEVKSFVEGFSKYRLLSEQHLSGGCVFGDVTDKGLDDASQTGKVIGSNNIYVADLSAVPLARVSTQMTAYLVGHHVGKQLYGPKYPSK